MTRVVGLGMSKEYRDIEPSLPPCESPVTGPPSDTAHTGYGSLIPEDSILSESVEPLSGIEFGEAIQKEIYASTLFAHKTSNATTTTMSTDIYSSLATTTTDEETFGSSTPQGREGTQLDRGCYGMRSSSAAQSAVGSPDFCQDHDNGSLRQGDNDGCDGPRAALDSPSRSRPPIMQTPVQVKRGVTAEVLAKILETTVNVEDYGKGNAKSIQQLADEIVCGDSSILYFPSSMAILRVVQPVFVKLRCRGHILVNTKDVFIDDNSRIKYRNSLLAEKMHSRDASARDAALRGIGEELAISLPTLLGSSPSSSSSGQKAYTGNLFHQIFPEDESTSSVSFCTKSSPSYPGLTSLYQTHLIELNLRLDQEFEEDAVEELRKLGLCVSTNTREKLDGLDAGHKCEFNSLSIITDEEFTSHELKSTGTVVHHWRWITEDEVELTRVVGRHGL